MADKEQVYQELLWAGLEDEGEEAAPSNLLARYYETVANGPMSSYRRIAQSGGKQGQSYYAHVLDGVNVLHKLFAAGVIQVKSAEQGRLEEHLLLAAFTVHDINKIEEYNNRDSRVSYHNIATSDNIAAELTRLGMADFFPEWEQYLEEIKLLAHCHQHQANPTYDMNLANYHGRYDHERVRLLGNLMLATDNLDLSHTLDESDHKQKFLAHVNALGKHHIWVTHRLGENRGLFSNLAHNTIVAYLQARHTHDGRTNIVDLLYYPEGVAYLIPMREPFAWSDEDTAAVARQLAIAVDKKKLVGFKKFIKGSPSGIKVDKSALQGGATFSEIAAVIYSKVRFKKFSDKKHNDYLRKLRPDIVATAARGDETAAAAQALLNQADPIVPFNQEGLRRGDLAAAYRNLLEDHLKDRLKQVHKREPWPQVYAMLEMTKQQQALADQVDAYRRGYFIARDCPMPLDTIFARIMEDLVTLIGEQQAAPSENVDLGAYFTYLQANLEVSSHRSQADFKASLRRYISSNHKQCATCSTPGASEELMAANVPSSLAVQFFSNRLAGGWMHDPKRNVCAICRTQFIIERLAWPSHSDKHSGEYTTFYLHLYPYAFFTAPYLSAIKKLFTSFRNENLGEDETAPPSAETDKSEAAAEPSADLGSGSLLLEYDRFYTSLSQRYDEGLKAVIQVRGNYLAKPGKLNGIGVPEFSESLGNTPTLPLTAPGKNSYTKQYIFALRYALIVAEFFACRVVLSRTPTPLFGSDYLDAHQLTFFSDGAPRSLRWLLPADGYRSSESYRTNQTGGGSDYQQRKKQWGHEQPSSDGYASYENIGRRLAILNRLASLLQVTNKRGETNKDDLVQDFALAAADDPMALYYVADRAIEQLVSSEGGDTHGREAKIKFLSKQVANLLKGITDTTKEE